MAIITQAEAVTRSNVIRDETTVNANTALRVGSLFRDIVDSVWPGDLDSDGIGNASVVVAGATVTEALDALNGAITTVSTNLSNYVPLTASVIAGAGLTGGGSFADGNPTLSIVADDGSIVANASTLRVGVISDTQHGNRGGGLLHALASASAAGFMSPAHFSAVDALPATVASAAVQIVAGAGMTGGGSLAASRTLNVVANADGSIVVNADDVQVGVLATDAQHGNRGGGALHAGATTTTAGFITLAGDISGTAANLSVRRLYGATIPAGSSLTTGHVLRVTGPSSLGYGLITGAGIADGAVDADHIAAGGSGNVLLGGASTNSWGKVTTTQISTTAGIVPTQLAAGAANTVLQSNGTANSFAQITNSHVAAGAGIDPSKVAASSTSGHVLTTVGGVTSWASPGFGSGTIADLNSAITDADIYTKVEIDNLLAGTQPIGSYVPTTRTISTAAPLQGGGSLGDDLSLSILSATTGALGVVRLAGDIAGSATSVSVRRLYGATVPAGASLTTGHVLQATGPAALGYGFIGTANLADGAVTLAKLETGPANTVLRGGTTSTWGAVTNSYVASNAAVAVSKLAAGANGQVIATVAGVPTWSALDVYSTAQVNELVDDYLPLAGGTMTGGVNMSNQDVTNVRTLTVQVARPINGGDLRIVAGAITPTHGYHTLLPEVDGVPCDLHTINDPGWPSGTRLILRVTSSSVADITLKHTGGNTSSISLADQVLGYSSQALELVKMTSASWSCVSNISNIFNTVQANSALIVGENPSTSGVIRMPHDGDITQRSYEGANVAIVAVTDGNLYVGPNAELKSGSSTVVWRAPTQHLFAKSVGTALATLDATSGYVSDYPVWSKSYLGVGATLPSSGEVRLAYRAATVMRSSGGANVTLADFDNISNTYRLGPDIGLVTSDLNVQIRSAGAGSIAFAPEGSDRVTVAADKTTFEYGTSKFVVGNKFVSIGSDPVPSGGTLRMEYGADITVMRYDESNFETIVGVVNATGDVSFGPANPLRGTGSVTVRSPDRVAIAAAGSTKIEVTAAVTNVSNVLQLTAENSTLPAVTGNGAGLFAGTDGGLFSRNSDNVLWQLAPRHFYANSGVGDPVTIPGDVCLLRRTIRVNAAEGSISGHILLPELAQYIPDSYSGFSPEGVPGPSSYDRFVYFSVRVHGIAVGRYSGTRQKNFTLQVFGFSAYRLITPSGTGLYTLTATGLTTDAYAQTNTVWQDAPVINTFIGTYASPRIDYTVTPNGYADEGRMDCTLLIEIFGPCEDSTTSYWI